MENIPILKDIAILIAVSVPMVIILHRLGIPSVIGFLFTGLLIGPSGFALVSNSHEIEVLAEIGIVLLLFTIGLELSVAKMLKLRKEGMLGGGLQLGLTILITTLIVKYSGLDTKTAVLFGFIVSVSSSAIVLKLLADSQEINSPHGSLSMGILVFQDLSIILMVMVTQSMGEADGVSTAMMVQKIFIALGTVAFIIVAIGYLAPKLFDIVVKLQNREVFILTIIMVCLGTAYLTSLVGLSLAIGAFIAGLIISESEYSHQIVAEILPLRDTFASLFFITIGMLLNLNYVAEHFALIMAVTFGVIALKSLVVIAVGSVLKYPLRLSILVGLHLAQVGEFAFILIDMGLGNSLLTFDQYQLILAVSIITMGLTPFLFKGAPAIAFFVGNKLGLRISKPRPHKVVHLSNHVIIVGYGINGRNLAQVLKSTGIAHIVIDINSDRVKQAKAEGHKAMFGDTSNPEMLKSLAVDKAKMIVLAVSDPIGTRRTIMSAKTVNPNIYIIVRTRYITEVEELRKLGADQVISEEFETSVEIFARVLMDYRVPSNIIQNQIDLIRREGYAMLRNPSLSNEEMAKITSVLDASIMDTFYIEEGSNLHNRSIADIRLTSDSGAKVLAIVRGDKPQTNPPEDFVLNAKDIIVVIGSHSELNKAMEILKQA